MIQTLCNFNLPYIKRLVHISVFTYQLNIMISLTGSTCVLALGIVKSFLIRDSHKKDLSRFVSNVLTCGAIVLTIVMAILRANIAEITNPLGSVSKINRVYLKSILVLVFQLGPFYFAKTTVKCEL